MEVRLIEASVGRSAKRPTSEVPPVVAESAIDGEGKNAAARRAVPDLNNRKQEDLRGQAALTQRMLHLIEEAAPRRTPTR